MGGWLGGLRSPVDARPREFYVDPVERLHVADPAHAVNSTDPNPVWGAPPATDPRLPYLADYPDTNIWDAATTHGLVLDYTPVDHTVGYDPENWREGWTAPDSGGNPGDVALANASAVAHSNDFGGSRQANYYTPPFQAHDERYLSSRFEGPPAPELPTLVGGGMRGLNGYGVNNPPLDMYEGQGFRRGWVDQTWEDRKMYDPTRVHDARWLTPDVAAVATHQPAVDSPYGPSFDSLARIITRQWQSPMLRREPPTPVESVLTDGSGDVYAEPSPWVVG